ncbi:MAG: hypothetical protein K9N55_11595 [Phycisphaerae bacterium]|nr:hypothetical protein [Phycisphaerae bacterium]
MSTETHANTPGSEPMSGTPKGSNPPHASRSPWWKRSVLAIAVVAAVMSAAALLPGSGVSRPLGPAMTHTVTRGELVVTVTERGTLESAENTEIKCRVRGHNTIIYLVESGMEVKPGDELIRLDTLEIEDAIAECTKNAHLTRSGAERARADVARAELAIPEYLEGRFRAERMTLEKDLVIAKSNLRTAENILAHAKLMAARGYVSALELEEKTFAVTQANLNVELKKTQIDELEQYTKAMELETLNGNLNAARAQLDAEEEQAQQDAQRRDLALEEFKYCRITAERGGLVIYPTPDRWSREPKVELGASVHMDQTLLLIPDLSRMQVKVGIHESIIDRIKPGLAARITLPDKTLEGDVSSVASVTRPAGWWTGNVVKYDTIVSLPSVEGLKPGMSAEVEVIIAQHEDVLLVPVSTVVETPQGAFCWISTTEGLQKRSLQLGDTNDAFIAVEAGLQEGDEVVLDPLASIQEAQTMVLTPTDRNTPRKAIDQETDHAE